MNRKWTWATGIVVVWLALDLATKSWALRALADGVRREILGGFMPLTLAYNRGAAFGLSIGDDPRLIFVPVTIIAVVFLVSLIRSARPGDWLRVVAASLVLGGALGNLYDRVRWERGVVDFLGPVDLGFTLFPIFNVADMGITCGAVMLAVSFWREDMEIRAEEKAAAGEGSAGRDPGKGAKNPAG